VLSRRLYTPCSRRTEIAIDLRLIPERESSGGAGRSPGERLGRWVLGGILAASLLLLVLFSTEIALLLAEQNDRRRLDPLFRSNLFAASAEHAYEGSLWKKRWHSYRPNARFSRRVGDLYYEVRINRWGFRTQDFEQRKPLLVFRVVCIGASTTVQGPTNETTYPALLQEMIRESHPDRQIEVLNLGISGTLSDYWLRRLERLFRLDPDLIIQYNGVNDILRVHLDHWADQHPWRAAAYLHSRVARRWLPFDSDQLVHHMGETLSHFDQLREAANERGVRYLLGTFAFPDYEAADDEFRTYLDLVATKWSAGRLRYRTYDKIKARFNRLLHEWAEATGQHVVQVASAIQSPALFADICHLRPEGIRLMAETFLPAVSDAITAAQTDYNHCIPNKARLRIIQWPLRYYNNSHQGGL